MIDEQVAILKGRSQLADTVQHKKYIKRTSGHIGFFVGGNHFFQTALLLQNVVSD